LQPFRSENTLSSPLPDYLRRRYGIADPLWRNEMQEIVLRAGGHVSLQPWILTDSKRAMVSPSN
jgi:hypothetical protein